MSRFIPLKFLVRLRQGKRALGLAPELGQEWLYHGTSNSRAKIIGASGFQDAKGGISSISDKTTDDNVGLLFLTSRRREAAGYARNQDLLDTLHEGLPGFNMKDSVDRVTLSTLRKDPLSTAEGTVFRFSVPKSLARKHRGTSPFIETEKTSPLTVRTNELFNLIKKNPEKKIKHNGKPTTVGEIAGIINKNKQGIDKRIRNFESHVVMPQGLGNTLEKTTSKAWSKKKNLSVAGGGLVAAGGGGYLLSRGESEAPAKFKTKRRMAQAEMDNMVAGISDQMFKSTYHGSK